MPNHRKSLKIVYNTDSTSLGTDKFEISGLAVCNDYKLIICNLLLNIVSIEKCITSLYLLYHIFKANERWIDYKQLSALLKDFELSVSEDVLATIRLNVLQREYDESIFVDIDGTRLYKPTLEEIEEQLEKLLV